ncbi:hypothetical protein NO2_1718, partial [Candidatus Termititenax persephonae]
MPNLPPQIDKILRLSGGRLFILILTLIHFGQAGALDYAVFSVPARIESLGGAAAARDNGLGGAYINPASLDNGGDLEIIASVGRIFADYTRYSFGLGRRLENGLVAGFSFTAAEISGLQRVEKIDSRPQVLAEDSSRYRVLICSLARTWLDKISLGLNLKYYNHALFADSATALGWDAGCKYAAGKNFVLGASARNVGGSYLAW